MAGQPTPRTVSTKQARIATLAKHDLSCGFRLGRSAHDALEALDRGPWTLGGGWVLDADSQGFFDALDHEKLRDLLRLRVVDGVVVRRIGKWLRAGGLETEGHHAHPETGSPQGGVSSPLLANLYLHEVVDRWWAEAVQPRMRGRAFMVRGADDFVMVFSDRADALRVHEGLPKRTARLGRTVHPEKTRRLNYRRPRWDGSGPKPGRFDFLGFTPHGGRSRRGRWVPRRETAKGRFSRALRAMNPWMSQPRHRPVGEQARLLGQKLRGHYGYDGSCGPAASLDRFAWEARRLWREGLGRCSQRAGTTWRRFNRLLRQNPLPKRRLRPRRRQLTRAKL